MLVAAGHGGKVLITDSNFAFSTNVNPAAECIHLNLIPDCVTVTQVLETVISAVPIEAVDVIVLKMARNRNIWTDFRQMLPEFELRANERYVFYELALERLSQRSANLRVAADGGTIDVTVSDEVTSARMQLIVDGAEHDYSGQELRRPLRVYSDSVPNATEDMVTISVTYDREVEVAIIRLIEGNTNALGDFEVQLLIDGQWQPAPEGTTLSQAPDLTIPYQLFDFQLPTPMSATGIQLTGKIQEDARFPELTILELDALSE